MISLCHLKTLGPGNVSLTYLVDEPLAAFGADRAVQGDVAQR